MPTIVEPVTKKKNLDQFVKFPWLIYRKDKFWVPPLIRDRYDKLDPNRNHFWQNAERELFIAYKNGKPAGTIAAFQDHVRNARLQDKVGLFGFFECLDDPATASLLFKSAADWLSIRGSRVMRGPYNPSPSDEVGILVDGFATRPAMMEAHSPPYYPTLFENCGFRKFQEIAARIVHRTDAKGELFGVFPEKFIRVAEIVRKRADLVIRPVNLKDWENEINIACDVYNQALAVLPDFLPVPFDEFKLFAESFRPFMDKDMARIAFVRGKPVGFALALPDMNEALQHINGRLDPFSMLKVLWFSRHLKRASFKILVMLPEFQGSGIESVLVMDISRAMWNKGYEEVDMSLTGDENVKSNRYQDNLGMKVYRRYVIFEKEI
jgi:GNAT superfamily N-acetyltransferase